MKILNCVPELQNLNGGPTICVLNILKLMNNNNYKVDLLVGSKVEKSFLTTNTFNTHIINPSIIDFIKIFKVINKYEIIHIHSFWTIFVFIIILISILLNKKIILTPHGMLTKNACSKRKIKSYFTPIIRLIMRKISLFHFLTKEEYYETIQYLKVPKIINFKIQPNWITSSKSLIHQKLDVFDKNYFNLVFLGRVHPVKNIDLQIQLVHKLNQNNIKTKLHLIGPIRDRIYLNNLSKKINFLKIKKFINFLGPIYSQKKFEFITDADICLLTSEFECNSISAIEIMQVGGLLVATRNCSLNHADKFGAIKEVKNCLDDLYLNVRTLLLDKGNKNNIIREKAILYVNNFHSTKAALDSLNFMYSNKNY